MLFNIILNNFITLQIKKQSPIGALQKMCSANTQQICRRTQMRKCDFSNVANQLFWNPTSVWVFSCKFAGYLQEGCFDENLCGTTEDFYSAWLPYFSIQVRVKFGWFLNIFLASSMFSLERAVFCLPVFWLNCCWNATWTAI